MVCLGWCNNGPSYGSLFVLALRLSTRMLPCWSTLVFFISAAHFQPKMIPTPGPLLVRASRRLYENMAYRWWISWCSLASLLPCNSIGERRPLTTTLMPPHSSHLRGLRTNQGSLLSLLSPLSSSTLESDGQLSSPQRVLRCGILCLSVFSLCSFPSIFPSVSRLRYGMVGIVAGDGAPRSLSDGRSSGVRWTRPFSFSDSLLGGSVPSCCCCFTLLAHGEFLWLLVVFCGTGWASTSIDNL